MSPVHTGDRLLHLATTAPNLAPASLEAQSRGGSDLCAFAPLRETSVIFYYDLAELYGVETKALNRAAKRNAQKFPADFMFQLSSKEAAALRCQSGTSNSDKSRARFA